MENITLTPINDDAIQKLLSDLGQLTSGIDVNRATPDQISSLANSFSMVKEVISRLDSQTKILLSLAETSQLINSSLEIDDVLTQVMDTIIQLTGAERCFLTLLNTNRESEIRIARNWEKASLQSSEIQFSNTIIQRVIQQKQSIVTTNAQDDARFSGQASVMMYQLRSILCVPLITRDVCIGAIYADNRIRSGIFSPSMLDSLIPFANQAAVAIENARLFEQIQQSLAEVKSLKQTMDNVFSSITSGVLTTDDNLQITMQNQSAEKILGKAAQVIRFAPINEVMQFSESLKSCFKRVLEQRESILGMEIQINNPILGLRDVRFSISPLKDELNKVVGTALVLEDYTEQKRLQANFDLFERMVSPAVIAQLQDTAIETGGERKTISVVFADIRGYTSYSERHSPEELVSGLNQYLAAAANVILEEGGTIDKFLGDAVMAWFNAPIPQEDHMLRAARSALRIQSAVQRLNLSRSLEDQLSFGIGIHTGEAVLGLIGASKRMDFTAIGDSINTARRIQEHATAGQILISEAVYHGLNEQIVAVKQPTFQAKGKNELLSVYELSMLTTLSIP